MSDEERQGTSSPVNPVARMGAIKLKLGALLGGAVVLTIVVLLGGAQLGLPTWITALVALAAGLVAVDVLGTGLTAPLRQMARQADRLADGQPVDPVDDSGRDEVGELARAFNRMAVEVAHTDRVRRELVANVSHELRTPLSALSATVENLVDGIEQAGPGQLRRIEAQVSRLSHLVDDLLDLSQLDAGATSLDRQRVDLRNLLVDAVHACGPGAHERVELRIEEDAALIEVDPVRFRQVLVNLVDNALRHGPGEEPVTVTAARDEQADVLRLTVADTGPGIPVEDAHRIFERFARTDAGRGTAAGGAGLGLAIARWTIELHGGSIRVDRPGEPGARLTLELPMTSPDHRDAGTADAADDHAGSEAPAPRRVVGTRVATDAPPPASTQSPVGSGLQLLPTPVAGLTRRALVAVAVAAVAAALLPLDGVPGIGFAVVLLVGAGATVVALERSLDGFGVACCAVAAAVAAQWAITDAAWVLVPVTLGAVLLAGLGIWGPRRFGEAARALLVGPLLVVVTPVALVRGARSQRGAAVARYLVPALATLVVLLVFGGLLGDADAMFARILDAVTPDLRLDESLVVRAVLAVLAAALVTTYVLVQRAGAVPTEPWDRPVRPRADWAVPLVALDVLLAAFVVVQLGVLFGGDQRVQETVGLTYAEYARTGFGQLLVVTLLTLGVVAVVARIAADEDRVLRDRLLGALVVLTGVILVSSVHRLTLYTDAFGLSRLRVSAYAVLLWVAVALALVVVAGTVARFAPHLPRTLIVATGALALAFTLVRPDAVIAHVNLARAEAGSQLDVDYLRGLSADAVPALVQLPPDVAAEAIDGVPFTNPQTGTVMCFADRTDGTSWNLARWRAGRAIAAAPDLESC